jgi:hypothetical protein
MTGASTADPAANAATKAQIVERLLRGRNGASLAELAAATGWQPHSCRAFLTGLRKKGRALTRDRRKDGATFWKLAASGKPRGQLTEAKVEA